MPVRIKRTGSRSIPAPSGASEKGFENLQPKCAALPTSLPPYTFVFICIYSHVLHNINLFFLYKKGYDEKYSKLLNGFDNVVRSVDD